MLLDPETWDLVQHIDSVLAKVADGEFQARVNAELMQSVIEITTPVCRERRPRSTTSCAGCAATSRRSPADGCRFASAGTHPFSLFERQRITAKDRYRKLVDQMQYIARRELIFGMHVHAAVDDPTRRSRSSNGLLIHLPEFLALSASSPFWRGEPTGLASSRQMVFSAFPRSGVPPRFESYEAFAELVGQLERTGCIADYTHIWWDIRPAPAARHGRAADLRRGHARRGRGRARRLLPGAREDALRARRVGRDAAELPPHPDHREQVARRAPRPPAPVMDLVTGRRNRVPISQLIRRTLRDLEPHARELGSERELEGIAEILARERRRGAAPRLEREPRHRRGRAGARRDDGGRPLGEERTPGGSARCPPMTDPSPGQSSPLPTALIGAALVVAIVFAASSNWYTTFMTVHVLCSWWSGSAAVLLYGVRDQGGARERRRAAVPDRPHGRVRRRAGVRARRARRGRDGHRDGAERRLSASTTSGCLRAARVPDDVRARHRRARPDVEEVVWVARRRRKARMRPRRERRCRRSC